RSRFIYTEKHHRCGKQGSVRHNAPRKALYKKHPLMSNNTPLQMTPKIVQVLPALLLALIAAENGDNKSRLLYGHGTRSRNKPSSACHWDSTDRSLKLPQSL